MKKNVTIVLDQEAARWVRVEAARKDTSVSRYVGELVERERARAEGYASAMEQFLSRAPRVLTDEARRYPSRAELHER